jgi:hypothetical protein
MRVELKKSGVLHCTRTDGSVTWPKPTLGTTAFFGCHELPNRAVETTLGSSDHRARLGRPEEVMEVERLVGALDLERAGAVRWAGAV